MPSATYALFRRAILERKLIVCRYQGKRREVAPHILGFKNRIEKVLVFQFGGDSNSMLPPGGEWRCFALRDVVDVQTMDGEWHTGGSHRMTQACIDIVDVDVNVPATAALKSACLRRMLNIKHLRASSVAGREPAARSGQPTKGRRRANDWEIPMRLATIRLAFASIAVAVVAVPAYAQRDIPQPKGTWQQPKEFQVPKGNWQEPGNIQIPKGINAVKTTVRKTAKSCERRLSVVGDALFDFDKSDLRPDAEETLAAAVPGIEKLGGRPSRIEGHTDSKGGDAYNQKLSEARARTVRDWLSGRKVIPASTPIRGYGRTMPVAPNTTPDGRDDPEGRQKNRRVEVVFEGCA